MKKVLIILIVLFSASVVYSQNTFVPETNFGIKAGGNISKILFDPVVEQDFQVGFVGGLVFRHISQKHLGIQIEFNFMQSGWSEILESPDTYSRRLNYLQLPFLSHFNFGGARTRIFFNIGPYVSYLLSEQEKMDLFSDEDIKEYYKVDINGNLGYGVSGGIGFSRRFQIGVFQIEGRINQSLTNIFKSDSEPFSGSLNQSGEIAFSYLFDFSRNEN